MSLTFTPSTMVDMSKERDWPANLGMLDWDSTGVLFTKRSLIEFLKYTGVTVDPNFTSIGKLPRYAKFGKVTEAEAIDHEDPDIAVKADSADSAAQSDSFIPSRRVRAVPGGSHTDIFAQEDIGDALSHAPPKSVDTQLSASTTEQPQAEEEESGINFTSIVKPSRRVRENPGGNASLANFWDSEATTDFKPSRRVRQGPGGHDSISEIF